MPAINDLCQDSESFEKGLASVESSMEKGRWKKAAESLAELLAANERADYVYAEKLRILRGMEQIALYQTVDYPTADDVLAGKVHKYDAAKGKIDVLFVAADLSDFEHEEISMLLPVYFTGPYRIEISGSRYPFSNPLAVSIDWGTPNQWWVGFGNQTSRPYMSRAVIGEDRNEVVERSDDRNMLPNKPFEVSVEVKKTKVIAKANRKSLLSAKRKNVEYGMFSLYGLTEYEHKDLEIHIKGEINPQWIGGKIRAAAALQLDEFLVSYVPEQALPSWLFEISDRALGGAGSEGGGERPYPGLAMSTQGAAFYSRMEGGLYTGSPILADQLEQIDDAFANPEIGLHATAADCLRMYVYLTHGMVEEALEPGARMVAAAPDHFSWVTQYAHTLMRKRDYSQARKVLQQARLQWPNSVTVFEALVNVEIQAHEFGAAAALVEKARVSRAFDREEGAVLQVMLQKAIEGPMWPNFFRHESAHYIVESETSKRRCAEIAALLESTYENFESPLYSIPGLTQDKFRVFLFSGEASYRRYMDSKLELEYESDRGVYHHFLQQIVVWDGRHPDEVYLSIIHEGFHQYLEVANHAPPLWFLEGLAGNLVGAAVVDGIWTGVKRRPKSVRYLLESDMLSLDRFVHIPNRHFMVEQRTRNYAQAWALLDFLRNSTPEDQAIYDSLFLGFRNSPSRVRVLRDVFAFVDMDALQKRFMDYLRNYDN